MKKKLTNAAKHRANERRRIVRHIEALRMMAAVKVYESNVMRDEVISALREVESQIRSGQHR